MACGKCDKCKACERTTYRTDEEKARINKRLNIIEGQIRGIKQMIDDDRYCDDVLIQLSAVDNAIKSLENTILENHLGSCVAYEIQSGNLDIIEEVSNLIRKIR